jgi:hypothetical protein
MVHIVHSYFFIEEHCIDFTTYVVDGVPIHKWMHVTHFIIPIGLHFEAKGEVTMVSLPSITHCNFAHTSSMLRLLCKPFDMHRLE